MVSQRCKIMVKEVLKKLNLHFIVVDLGEVEIMEELADDTRAELKEALRTYGLELMENKKEVLIEKIRLSVIEFVYNAEEDSKINYSEYLSEKLNQNYAELANTFSEMKGITLQQFIINQKIERIKELIIYGELTISEIAYRMNYSSAAHLCNQFKKVTGLPPSHFKNLKDKRQTATEVIHRVNATTE